MTEALEQNLEAMMFCFYNQGDEMLEAVAAVESDLTVPAASVNRNRQYPVVDHWAAANPITGKVA